MKNLQPPHPALERDHCRHLALVACASLALSVAPAAEVEPAPADAPRDHVIFVGLDLTLGSSKASGQLVDIERHSARLKTPEGITRISLSSVNAVSMARQMRIGRGMVNLTDLQAEQTFTPTVDPKRLALEQTMDVSYAQEQRTVAAMSQLSIAETQSSSSPDGAQVLLENQARARNEVDAAVNDARGLLGNAGSAVHQAGTRNSVAKSDAFRVSFSAASAMPVPGAFAAFVVKFRVPGVPGEPTTFIRFSELPEIGPQPRNLSVTCTGLPPGYEVESYEIHLYDGQGELATSLSDKAVTVTRTEAVQYLLLRDQLENKHASLPPRIIRELLPADIANHIPPAARHRAAEVNVTAEGTVTQVKLDTLEPRSIDAYVESVLREAYFLPALAQGVPTATATTVTFAELLGQSERGPGGS
jgi:hypothetical protein